jgi:hypothetical protein
MFNDLTIDQLLSSGKFDTSMYVYYNIETGEVLSLSNEKDDSNPFIKVEASEVTTLISGKESFNDYKVVLNLATKEYVLQAYYDKEAKYLSWDDSIYRIPVVSEFSNLNDISIVQDTTLKTWQFNFSPSVLKMLLNRQQHIGTINFYITKSFDANILYKTIRINVPDIDEDGRVTITSETAASAASIYCFKIFDLYGHQVK